MNIMNQRTVLTETVRVCSSAQPLQDHLNYRKPSSDCACNLKPETAGVEMTGAIASLDKRGLGLGLMPCRGLSRCCTACAVPGKIGGVIEECVSHVQGDAAHGHLEACRLAGHVLFSDAKAPSMLNAARIPPDAPATRL